MDRKRIREIISHMIRSNRDPFIQSSGAQLVFYLIMSLVPLVILVVQACAVFAISPEMASNVMKDFLTPEAIDALEQLIPRLIPQGVGAGSGLFSIVAALTTLWSASKVQFCIVGICNYANSGKTRVDGFVRERIRSLINVVLLILILMVSLIVLVYGQVILELVSSFMTDFLGVPFHFNGIWYLIRWPASIAVYAAILSYIYYSSPTKRVSFRKVLPGGIFAAIGMMIASLGYSVYVTTFANYNALYGGLASVIAMLFWFYLMGKIFVFGILFNQACERTK
ncbi:MAG: YihY/virulence factor BrkB family protein [Firmicutes bacterium]|nr:YihY/virulence factor BrkB family protein [Bacillota bacterium]